MSTNITFNSYNFKTQGGPIPFLTINKNIKRNGAGESLGTVFQFLLNGTLTPLPSGNVGYTNLDAMQDALLSAFSNTGRLIVTCDSNTLVDVYARVSKVNLNPSNDNWVQTTPYSIELEVDGTPATGTIYVDEVDESWTVQVDESTSLFDWTYSTTGDRNATVLNITHEVSAKGVSHYESGGLVKPAWEQAKDWVTAQLGIASSDFSANSVINLDAADFSHLNHIRVEQRNEQQGSYSVSESWVSIDTSVGANGIGSGIEDFNVSVKQEAESDITTIDVNGTIRGLEARNMLGSAGSYAITATKYANASGSWNVVRPRLHNRASLIGSSIARRDVNPIPLSYSVAHNPTQGTISYSYVYDDRPCNIIPNAIFERINIVNVYPNDVFSVIPVLGRANGPVMQDMNTVTESRRSVNIDVVVPVTGCTLADMNAAKPTGAVRSFLCEVQQDLADSDVSLFLASDQDNWDPKFGRYTRSVEWVYTNCSGTPPTTDFC